MFHEPDTSDPHIRREKERARELRKSRWWQNLIAKATCYYCGKALAKAEVTMDHVVPLAQGGKSTPGNVVASCKACNTLKRDMTAVEWTLHVERMRRDPPLRQLGGPLPSAQDDERS